MVFMQIKSIVIYVYSIGTYCIAWFILYELFLGWSFSLYIARFDYEGLWLRFSGISLSFLVHKQIVLTKAFLTHQIFYSHYLLKSIIFDLQYGYNNMSLIGCCFYRLLISVLEILVINVSWSWLLSQIFNWACFPNQQKIFKL